MTHAFPNEAELARINKWIDRHVQFDYLQHRHRMDDLLNTQPIARSIIERLFLARTTQIYTRVERVLTSYRNHVDLCSHKASARALWAR